MLTTFDLQQIKTEEETGQLKQPQQTGFVVLNPVAGKGNAEKIKQQLQSSLGEGRYDLYETTGDESLADVVETAVAIHDYAWVAAIGGDGTVSQVANGLVDTDIPLAIIPAGTGNAMAQALHIPLDLEAACNLLQDTPRLRKIDGIQVGEQTFFMHLGLGLESLTMKETSSDQKNRWGIAAYLWTAVKQALGWQPHHFTLTVDGEQHDLVASELVIANTGDIGVWGLKWEESIAPDDGRIDIAVLRARSLADYVPVIWTLLTKRQRKNDDIQIYHAYDEIRLNAWRSFPMHGDGELFTPEFPFTAVVTPQVLNVIVPPENE